MSFANHSQTSLRQLKRKVTVKSSGGPGKGATSSSSTTYDVKRRALEMDKNVYSGLEDSDTDDEMDSGDEWGI